MHIVNQTDLLFYSLPKGLNIGKTIKLLERNPVGMIFKILKCKIYLQIILSQIYQNSIIIFKIPRFQISQLKTIFA